MKTIIDSVVIIFFLLVVTVTKSKIQNTNKW